jgi:hypothetical protein
MVVQIVDKRKISRRLYPVVYMVANVMSFGYFPTTRAWIIALAAYRDSRRLRLTATTNDHELTVDPGDTPEFFQGTYDSCEAYDSVPEPLPFHGVTKFRSSPADARKQYKEFRKGAWRTNVLKEIETLEAKGRDLGRSLAENSDIARGLEEALKATSSKIVASDCRNRLRQCSQVAKKIQAKRKEVALQLKQLNALDQSFEPPEVDNLDQEFDRLMRFPGIADCGAVEDDLILLLLARFTYQGVRYDLGDWELRVSRKVRYVQTRELRCAVKPSWIEKHCPPVYRISCNQFCFGNLDELISSHLASGQALEAVELAVVAMQSINEGDLSMIDQAFYEAKPVGG